MGHQIIKQPDDRYAVFSNNVDTWVVLDATADELVEMYAEDAAKRAREDTQRIVRALQEGRAGSIYRQFAMGFEEADEASFDHTGKKADDLRKEWDEDEDLPISPRASGWFYTKTKEQRHLTREMAALLRDSVYKREGGGGSSDNPDDPCFATWTCSALRWSVDYGANTDGKSMWARVYGPNGLHKFCFEITSVEDMNYIIP